MNKLIVISIFSLLALGLEGQTISKKQTELIKNQVDSVFQKMVVYAEKLDFEKLSLGVDDTYNVGFISNNKYYSQYASLIEDTKLTALGISKQDISIKEKKITVLSEKIVILTATGTAKSYIDDGREILINFHWSFVYEKINNNWKVIQSHQSGVR